MKRVFLLFVIIGMCMLVAVGGTMTFLNSNSVLKQSNQAINSASIKGLKIFVDITENRMYLISEGKIIKTYSISSGKYKSPSPIGEWTIISKDTWGEGFGGRWMGFNVPWAAFKLEHKIKAVKTNLPDYLCDLKKLTLIFLTRGTVTLQSK